MSLLLLTANCLTKNCEGWGSQHILSSRYPFPSYSQNPEFVYLTGENLPDVCLPPKCLSPPLCLGSWWASTMSQVMVETRTGISIRHCSQWMGQVKPHWEVKQDKELHGKKRCFIATMGLYCPATREKQSCFLCRKTDTNRDNLTRCIEPESERWVS